MRISRSARVLFIVSAKIFCQESIVLESIAFETQKLPIYIKEVIDERKDKFLGLIENTLGEDVMFKLYPPASHAIQAFMDASFSYSMEAKPIYIKIKNIQIQQSQSSISDITARAYVHLIFLEKQKDTLKELFNINHYEDQMFHKSDTLELFDTHERRIRAALEYCVQGFINNYRIKNSPNHNATQTQFKTEYSIEGQSELGYWFNFLTFKKVFSKHKEGWKISYIGFADSNEDFIIPFVVSYDQYSLKSKSLKDKGYKSVDSYALGGGLDGYLKIYSGVYANIALEMFFGLENLKNLENSKENNFLIGLSSKQGVKIIPWKKFGIVIGAGFFQQIQNSRVYKTDLGFELELGINF